MKKLLELLGTITIASSAMLTVIAAAPNRKHNIKKRQNNEDISTTPKIQNEQQFQSSKNTDSQTDIIEKEINLDENYSENIQKMLQELIDEKYLDPLRNINMGGLISKELNNKTIISKLEELEPKMANWIKEWQNNKEKILILTLKNSNNKSIKLVINLNNLYLLGFINNQNHYFYFDDELLEKIKQHNQEEIAKLNNLKNKLNKLKENKFLFNEEKVKEYLQEKNKLIPLKEKEKNIKKLNYNNELNSLNKKLSNLQGENLKDDEEKIKTLNKLVIKKYNCQKINLNYTGAYTSDGLNVVIKENGKPDKGKNINISNETLKDAISNLADYDNNKQENQTIKDDLVRMIFITSEAMRFQCDEKTLEIFANIKNIDELKKIISKSKNILKNIQEKIFNKNKIINWKDYTSQLRGDWKKYSEQFNKFRIEIWEELIKIKKMYDFIYNNQDIINEIFKKENENYKIIKAVGDLFDKPQNQKISDIKIEILNYIQKQLELRKFLGKLYNMINIKQININENQLIYNIGINKNQENFLLVISVYQKNLDIIKLLINLIPKSEMINGNSNDFFSPLNIALALRHTEIVKELLKHKNINVNKTEPICHMSVLHNAVRLGETEIVKELLKHPKINTDSSLKKIIPNLLEAEMEKHFNSEEFEKILKNKIKLCNELLEKVQDEQQKNKIIRSLEETKNALKELKEPKRNEKLDKEKQETEENKKISEEIIKKLEEDINSKEFEEKIKKIFISELNKYFKENNELKEFPKIMQNYRNLTKEKQNELVKELVEIKLWDFIIINRNLGEIADNSEQTILKHVRELNPKLDFLKKIKVTNINITTALITSNDENCPGGVIVTFTLAKKASKPSKTQKTITKDESDFGGLKRGFLNSSPKSNSNINTNAGGSQSQGSSSKRVSVGEQAGTSGTQNQNTKTTNQNNLYDVPADNSCLFWSVVTSYLLPARNNNEEFRNRFIQLFGELQLSYLSYVQTLLHQFDLSNTNNFLQDWYQDTTAHRLVRVVFRNRVVNYIERNLDNPTQSNANQAESFRSAIQISENEVVNNYLDRMRNINAWGGEIEILAMNNLLNANIGVGADILYQRVNQNSNNNNIAISYVELTKGSGIHNHYNFALTPEENRTDRPIAINDNQGNIPVVDTTKRPDNLPPTTSKSDTKSIKLPVDDHAQHHTILSNNNEDDDANQGNIINAPEPTTTPLQKDEYHFVDKKTEEKSLKNDENLEINLIKNNNKIKQNVPVVNKPINKNIINSQISTATKAINKYNTLSKEEKLKKLNEINRYYQTLSENDKKAFKEKLTNTGLAALSGGALTAYGTKMTVSDTAAITSSSVTNEEAMEMTPLFSTSTTESLAAAETITVAETAAVEGGVIAGETGTAAALAPETLGLSLVIGGLAIAGTWMYFAFHHHATSDIALPTSIHHNVYDNIEKWYKFLAHDKLKIKINKNTWNEIKQNKNSPANIIKIIKNKFVINDHSGWGGSVTNEDFNTFVKVIVLHFEQINGYFEILDNENDGFVIITNTEGDWLGIE